MQAIVTKYHGPTNVKGARISATSASGLRASIPYPHELSIEDAHKAAAQALCDKLNWHNFRVMGGIKGGYAHVFVEEQDG